MARLVPQPVQPTGSAVAFAAAAAGGDIFAAADGQLLVLKNTSAAAINVTLVTPAELDGLAVADIVVSIPATNGERYVRVPARLVRDANGDAALTYSAVAGLTVAVVQL